MKSPNSEPESIYLATRIQMRVNGSRRCYFFLQLRGYAFVWRMLQCWNPQILNQRVFTYQPEYRCGLIDLGGFFFTAEWLCFRLKNVAVMKCPNSEPESIYLATRIQMRVNRSRRFSFIFFYSCGIMLSSEECCSAEIPKFWTREYLLSNPNTDAG